MTVEKKIFPQWNKRSEGRPEAYVLQNLFGISKQSDSTILILEDKHGDIDFCYERKCYDNSAYIYWAIHSISHPDSERAGYDISEVANYKECEARKAVMENPGKVLGEASQLVRDIKKSYDWIPGNEPEKTGWYEVTYERGEALVSRYWKFIAPGNHGDRFFWNNYCKGMIIAYKPITLSDPYVKPERELRCPICTSNDCGIDEDDGYFFCKDCCQIKVTKEQIFKIYDKLNN